MDLGVDDDTAFCHHQNMKRKNQRTLELIFARPVSANVRWADIEALLIELGGQLTRGRWSRSANGLKITG